ncbi:MULTISPECIES: peptide IlvX [Shigella]|uniref:Uncharacterized protein n=2 Tax=Shigella TaxID=620 RepID=A0A3T2UY52_SHIFL|nr:MULTISPECIES: peptide IlvX [Shigella]EFA1829604.1 hypothetical protein [Escherichia coli]EFY6542929.1 hypothetical protein [Shigella sonnei]EAA0483292.1 hypothetical protein [Shigella flexneri]EAA0703607.1 hypothetical protein [Shigella boydii]EAA0843152.1 hypothetical protein [Shigella boydii]
MNNSTKFCFSTFSTGN